MIFFFFFFFFAVDSELTVENDCTFSPGQIRTFFSVRYTSVFTAFHFSYQCLGDNVRFVNFM